MPLINRCKCHHRHRWIASSWGGPYPCVEGGTDETCEVCNKTISNYWYGTGHSYTAGSNDYFENSDGSYGYTGKTCINCGSGCDHSGAYEGEDNGWGEFSCGTCGYQYFWPTGSGDSTTECTHPGHVQCPSNPQSDTCSTCGIAINGPHNYQTTEDWENCTGHYQRMTCTYCGDSYIDGPY